MFMVSALAGLLVALIARIKRRDAFWWWVYDFVFWFAALPHVLLTRPGAVDKA